MAGVNPFGVVPMVYIPHIRTKGFYGESMIDGLEGIVKEINLRAGDYGDAVSEDAHVWLAMRNVNGTPRTIEAAPGLKVVDLKSSPSVTGNESKPDIFPLKQVMVSDALGKLWDRLYDQFRRDSFPYVWNKILCVLINLGHPGFKILIFSSADLSPEMYSPPNTNFYTSWTFDHFYNTPFS